MSRFRRDLGWAEGRGLQVLAVAGALLAMPSSALADTNLCATYGYSGNTTNVLSCVSGPNNRTITCRPGFYASPPQLQSITLVGNAPFRGCLPNPASQASLCTYYGYSGKPNNAATCVDGPGAGKRTITCASGYVPFPPVPPNSYYTSATSEVLLGSTPFGGCQPKAANAGLDTSKPVPPDTCAQYGYSGKSSHAVSCVAGPGRRTITCGQGWVPLPPKPPNSFYASTSSVTLLGATPFAGCMQIIH